MTREEIEKLSDEELNALVATEVMGWGNAPSESLTNINKPVVLRERDDLCVIGYPEETGHRADNKPIYRYRFVSWSPSSNIAAAMQVVYEMNARGFWIVCGVLSSYSYALIFVPNDSTKDLDITINEKCMAGINELPRAICRAALLAVMQP